MNTQKETEWDRVAHSKTQTHVRTQTEPVELELMWPGAATHTHTLKSHLQLKIQPTERLYCWHSETDRKRRTRKKGKTVVTEWIRRLRGSEARKGRRKRETDRQKGEGKIMASNSQSYLQPTQTQNCFTNTFTEISAITECKPLLDEIPLRSILLRPQRFHASTQPNNNQ